MTMRAGLASCTAFVSVLAMTGFSFAGACRFHGSRVFCDSGCIVLRRWVDHDGREWIRYTCQPPPSDDLVVVAVIAVVMILVALIAAAASMESAAAQSDDDQVAQDTAKTNQLMKKLEDDAREVDAHIASVLAKIGDGDRHGSS